MQHPLQAPPLEMQPTSGFKESLAHGTGIDRQDGQDTMYVRHATTPTSSPPWNCEPRARHDSPTLRYPHT